MLIFQNFIFSCFVLFLRHAQHIKTLALGTVSRIFYCTMCAGVRPGLRLSFSFDILASQEAELLAEGLLGL